MQVQTRRQVKKIKIGDLFFKLGIEPYQNNQYGVEFKLKVNTPYGFQPVDALFTTERQKTVTTYFSNGKRLSTSAHHLLKEVGGDWKKVEELQKGSKVETELGETTVTRQIYKNKEKVLYDMTVRDVHCYYSNGILSHNSWLMVAIAGHAVQLGYKVNYYTLELGEDYVGKRFDCYFTGYGIEEVNTHRKEVEKTLEALPGKLIIKEYPPKGASVSTIKSHIQQCTDLGHKPDLVIIDYVDYLKPPSRTKYTERKDEIDDVFIATKALAKELKIPILTPSQVNRSGAKDDIIEGDKVAGSYDKMMVADVCLSLSRKREDKILGIGRIHIMKNRYGMDGHTYDVKINTNNGHVEFLGKMSLMENDGKPKGTYRDLATKFFELEGVK